MKIISAVLLMMVLAGCAQEYDTKGVVYTGVADLSIQVHQFIASNEVDDRKIDLTMTGPHELTFSFNNKISHIDFEEDVIIIKSETEKSAWTAKKVRGGFELEDGTRLQYGKCKGWTMCLLDSTNMPILKGRYLLTAKHTEITLWMADGEKHVELLGLMTNGLFNRSRNERESIESSLETLSTQVWTY